MICSKFYHIANIFTTTWTFIKSDLILHSYWGSISKRICHLLSIIIECPTASGECVPIGSKKFQCKDSQGNFRNRCRCKAKPGKPGQIQMQYLKSLDEPSKTEPHLVNNGMDKCIKCRWVIWNRKLVLWPSSAVNDVKNCNIIMPLTNPCQEMHHKIFQNI